LLSGINTCSFIHVYAINPVAHPPQSKRLLEQVREVFRYKHYNLKTEQAYLYWVRFFIRWCGRDGQMRHPRDMLDLPWLAEVQRPTRPKRIPSVLTVAEVAALPRTLHAPLKVQMARARAVLFRCE